MNNDDSEQIRRLRNHAQFDYYKNSLIEWTLSPEWTEAPRVVDSRGNRLARGHKVPGITCNEINGEIPDPVEAALSRLPGGTMAIAGRH